MSNTTTFLLYPAWSEETVQTCIRIGRPDWVDVPWIWYEGDTKVLDEQIVEDLEDFPEVVMELSKRLSAQLYDEIVAPHIGGANNFRHFRWYPGHALEELETFCADNGWKDLRVDNRFSPILYPFVDAELRRNASDTDTDAFRAAIEDLEKRGWHDSRASWERARSPRMYLFTRQSRHEAKERVSAEFYQAEEGFRWRLRVNCANGKRQAGVAGSFEVGKLPELIAAIDSLSAEYTLHDQKAAEWVPQLCDKTGATPELLPGVSL